MYATEKHHLTPVPFLDLVTPHEESRDELTAVFHQALSTAGFIGGPMVQGFEHDFAKFCETEHCIGVGSGTDALRFALIAAGIGPGDAVVTVPNTFIATTEAITQAGARPAFVDIDEATYNMDPAKLAEYLEIGCAWDRATKRLRDRRTGCRVTGIVPVHLYGQPADMDPILTLGARYGVTVIEDACQAHGAEYFSAKENRWRKAGSMGRAGAFSFYPGKNLGACGEAGAVTTNDPELARKVRMLRDHGQSRKYYHDIEGYNGRLDAIQAGVLQVKLKHLAGWNESRCAAARRYRELFSRIEGHIILPAEHRCTRPVYHLFVVLVENREEIMTHAAEAGIGTAIHYPVPLHLQKSYAEAGYSRGDFPVAERAAAHVLSLPMFPQIRRDQQARVVSEVAKCLSAAQMCWLGAGI